MAKKTDIGKSLMPWQKATLTVAFIGSVNWLLVGTLDFNLVTALLGSTLTTIVYVVVGLSGLLGLWWTIGRPIKMFLRRTFGLKL